MMREVFRERNSHFVANGRNNFPGVNKVVGGKDFRERLVSVFIGNLNPAVDSMGLWGIFKVFGKVRDVFLSVKKDPNRSRFAFIRFETLDEAEKVAKKVNGMHVYSWPIVAKVADYDWSRRRTSPIVQKGGLNRGVGKIGSIGDGVNNKDFNQAKRSYMESLKGVNLSQEEGVNNLVMSWSETSEEEEWLSKIAKKRLDVGVLLILGHLEDHFSGEVVVKMGNRSSSVKLVEQPVPVSDEWVTNFLGLRPGFQNLKGSTAKDVFDRLQPIDDVGRLDGSRVGDREKTLGNSRKLKECVKAVSQTVVESPKRGGQEAVGERGDLDKGKGRWTHRLKPTYRPKGGGGAVKILDNKIAHSESSSEGYESGSKSDDGPIFYDKINRGECSKTGAVVNQDDVGLISRPIVLSYDGLGRHASYQEGRSRSRGALRDSGSFRNSEPAGGEGKESGGGSQKQDDVQIPSFDNNICPSVSVVPETQFMNNEGIDIIVDLRNRGSKCSEDRVEVFSSGESMEQEETEQRTANAQRNRVVRNGCERGSPVMPKNCRGKHSDSLLKSQPRKTRGLKKQRKEDEVAEYVTGREREDEERFAE
ncbi:hypothetical protein Q3G72_005192 [Acer saccharum]|nr:hypothetical protein Q3G72_005192 [Acer saccharum]